MSERSVWSKMAGVLGLAVVLAGSAVGQGGPIDVPASSEPRVPVGQVVSAAGFVASDAGEPFNRLLSKETVYSRDLLIVLPGLQAVLEPTSKAVSLTLWGNLPGLSDSPVLESSVILHDTRAYDLDFSMVRGRIVLTNTKKKGPAHVWMRRGNRMGVEFTLPEPGDSVALELSGRWPAGVPFNRKNKDAEPTVSWELFVLKGNVEIRANKDVFGMSAPPGPSYFRGDSVHGPDPTGPQRRNKLPSWADPEAAPPPESKMIASLVEEYRNKLKAKDAFEAGMELMAAADKDPNKSRAEEVRRIYVYALAATDHIPQVVKALENDSHDDIRKTAVIALRHWIGAAPGRDEKLYETLTGVLHYSKAEAETILQLLHSQFPPDQPETYETLIAYLNHSKLAVRELAAWHLYRLAPAGRDISYNAGSSPAERAAKLAEWKKLVPSGELPPSPKEVKKE